MRIFFGAMIFLASSSVGAFDYPYLARSPEGLLMGDAYTAISHDSFSLFYNPASMARHKNDFTLYPLNPYFSGSDILNDKERFEDFPTELVDASEVLMDYPAHVSAGIAPGFKFFNVGVSFIASESYDILLRNRAHPMLDVDMKSDKGVILGVGIPIGGGRINGKSRSGSQTSLGVAAKYIERTGLRDTMALSGSVVADAIGQDELDKLIRSLGRVKGIGYGFDAGVEHVSRRGSSQYVIGLSALDITGTKFKEAYTPDGLEVSDIKQQINLGMAAGQDFKLFHYILSADVRELNRQMDFMDRIRLGAQVGLLGFKFMAGLSNGYYSYGATANFGMLSATAGFFDIGIKPENREEKGRRFIIYVSLFDFSFDA